MCQLVEDSILANLNEFQLSESNAEMSQMDIISGLIILIEKASTEGFNIKILESNKDHRMGRVGVVINLRLSQCFYDLVIQIWIDVRYKKLQCRASFLQDERYVLTESSQKRRMICRKLIKFNNQIEQSGLKFIQNMKTGKLMILTINDQSSMFITKDILWLKIKAQIKLITEVYQKYSTQLYQIMNKQKYKQYLLRNNGNEELKRIKKQQLSYTKLCKQLEVSHVNFGFSCRADQASFPALQKSQSHLSKLKQFIFNRTPDTFEKHSRKLFFTNYQEYLDVPFHMINYEIQHNQSKLYSSYLKTPVPRDPNPGENKFIFNHIEIVKPQSIRFHDTQFQGGMSKILVSKLSFYYCESISSVKKSSQKKTVLKKKNSFKYPNFFQGSYLQGIEQKKGVLPSEKNSAVVLTKMIGTKVPKKKGKQVWDEKNENQKNIIKLFKSGVSAYVLKYYISKQVDFSYKNCLLMDFLPSSQPLSNYIEIFSNTLSLNSKAFLLVNLANSLRFLNDYHVVHMDLGLNNILVYRDYLIKLIDFGEAYSENVNTSNGKYLKRGYTFPFSSPEYFQRTNSFTIKQDIFAFGIIAWKIIFGDYMFFPSEKALESYRTKSYFNKIYLAPERGEAYANQQTIYLIYRLLFKCLNPDELLRCEPSWLTIFFKIIYFYLL